MKLFGSILTLFASLSYLGCTNSSSPETTQTIQNAFPLKIGNSWTYQASGYDPNGILHKDTARFSIDSAGTVNGHAGFYISMFGVGFIYYSGDDLMASDLTGDDPQFWMRYPMETGEEFVIKDTSSGSYRERDVMRLVSKNTTVTVPAGTFTCIWYKTTGMDNTLNGTFDTTTSSDLYVALGVGQIKQENYLYYPDPANPEHTTTELISYTVK
jgi:uncharacterized protein DUF3108